MPRLAQVKCGSVSVLFGVCVAGLVGLGAGQEGVATPVEPEAETHEWWETMLLCFGFIGFFLLGLWFYYRTSEGYRIRVEMSKAGYVVPNWTEYFQYCFGCCMGPFMRRSWENNNRYYRHKYPEKQASKPWLGKTSTDAKKGKWSRLRRGDEKIIRRKVREVTKKAFARMYLELINKAIDKAIQQMQAEARKNAQKKRDLQNLRARAAKIKMTEAAVKQRRQTALFQMEIDSASSSESSDDEEQHMMANGNGGGADWDMGVGQSGDWDMGVGQSGDWGVPIHEVQSDEESSNDFRKSQYQSPRGSTRFASANPLFNDGMGAIPDQDFDTDSSDDGNTANAQVRFAGV